MLQKLESQEQLRKQSFIQREEEMLRAFDEKTEKLTSLLKRFVGDGEALNLYENAGSSTENVTTLTLPPLNPQFDSAP